MPTPMSEVTGGWGWRSDRQAGSFQQRESDTSRYKDSAPTTHEPSDQRNTANSNVLGEEVSVSVIFKFVPGFLAVQSHPVNSTFLHLEAPFQ